MEIADAIALKQYIATSVAIVLTAAPFALLHGAQLKFAWGPVLVIFLVGAALGTVRAVTDSVAAGLLVHVAYNATISILMFVATDGFGQLERLNQRGFSSQFSTCEDCSRTANHELRTL